VVYASSSSALATGSALTFDGTTTLTAPSFQATTTTTALVRNVNNSFLGLAGGTSYSNGAALLLTGNTYSAVSQAFIDADVSNFRSAGAVTTYMTLTSTGLGIGTSSPSTKLHVVGVGQVSGNFFAGFGGTTANIISSSSVTTGGAGFSEFLFGNASVNNRGYLTYGHATDSLLIGTAGSTRATLDSSGNLGLGVTPSAWISSYRAFSLGYSSNGMFSGGNTQSMVHSRIRHSRKRYHLYSGDDSGGNWKFVYWVNY
jgi:hypothetical protein